MLRDVTLDFSRTGTTEDTPAPTPTTTARTGNTEDTPAPTPTTTARTGNTEGTPALAPTTAARAVTYGVELCAAPGGPVRVLRVIPDSPAERCGRVFVGDTVLCVDNEQTVGAPLARVADALAAAASSGRAVRLLLQADKSSLYLDLIDRERVAKRRTLVIPAADTRGITLASTAVGKKDVGASAAAVVTAASATALKVGLRIGHRIVEVDGVNVEEADAADVSLLLAHGGYARRTIVVVEQSRRRVVHLAKDPASPRSQGFGLTVRAGGVNVNNGGLAPAGDVWVTDIRADSPAAHAADLHVGDRVLSINNISVNSLPFTDVV
jgi:C-terminal processing protease CtpA/Prc